MRHLCERSCFVIIVIIIVISSHGCDPYPPGEKLVKRWDLELPVFENVVLALKNGNPELAAKTIVRYYESRKEENWPLTRQQILDEFDDNKKKILAETQEILDNRYTLLNQTFTLGSHLPWTKNPSKNKEWIWELNRHYWWMKLARAYVLTGDEKYAQLFAAQAEDWIRRNPPLTEKDENSPTWRLLEAGLRMSESWSRSLGIFITSPSIHWEVKWLILNSIYDHAEFLAQFHTARNHLLMESNGLASVAAFFPEFRKSKEWSDIAFRRLREELDIQVYEDGVHFEVASHYQCLSIQVLEKSRYLSKLCGDDSFSNHATRVLKKMYLFLAWIVRPDGTLPLINDGTQQNVKSILYHASKEYNSPFMLYAATAGKRGEGPASYEMSFPYGGFSVFRTGWKESDLFLIVDHGPLGGDHGHEDFLNFEIWGNGYPLIVDPGTYTYDGTDPFRQYFFSTAAHNGILINGFGQNRRCNRKDPAKIKPTRSKFQRSSTKALDFITAEYSGPYGTEEEVVIEMVTHRRFLFFAKPYYFLVVDFLEASEPGYVESLWHFSPQLDHCPFDAGSSDCYCYNDHAGMKIIPLYPLQFNSEVIRGARNPYQGWYSPGFNLLESAAVFKVSLREVAKKACFATVLIPDKRVKLGKFHLKTLPLYHGEHLFSPEEGIALELKHHGFRDTFIISNMNRQKKQTGEFKTLAPVSFTRYADGDDPISSSEFLSSNKMVTQ